ncbi:hypothetical protein [Rhizobium ruizarguesonis]|uniref:hypothetical protein n=1 Tax=Rhizobium ruizarguesonis TaxID=2081791 RepID=UPI001FE08E0F|nr:hypothetical protein [Rhizobium ruizarguesonis]
MEWNRKSWREEDPPERHATNRIGLREVMPVDFLPASNKVLSPVISGVAITPYADRLRALQEAERIHEMMSNAAYAMQKEVPGEILSVVDRLWFGEERAFQAARDAFRHVETELERWDSELEAERSALARSILGILPGDIVTSESRGKLLRLSVTGVTLYFGRQQCQFHGVRNSLSKGRSAWQIAGDPKYIFYRREANSIARARLPDGGRRMLRTSDIRGGQPVHCVLLNERLERIRTKAGGRIKPTL